MDEVFTWTFPGSPVSIRLHLEVISRLARLTSGNSSGRPAGGQAGILLGSTSSDGSIEMTGCEPVIFENGNLHQALVHASRQIEKRQPGSPEKILGYYRTHFQERLALEAQDLQIIDTCFQDPRNVFLLARPDEDGPANAGFFFWDGNQVQSEFCFLEFPLDPAALPIDQVPRRIRPVPVKSATGLAPAKEPQKAAGQRSRWPAIAASMALALGAAGWAAWQHWHQGDAFSAPASSPVAQETPAQPVSEPEAQPQAPKSAPKSAPVLPEVDVNRTLPPPDPVTSAREPDRQPEPAAPAREVHPPEPERPAPVTTASTTVLEPAGPSPGAVPPAIPSSAPPSTPAATISPRQSAPPPGLVKAASAEPAPPTAPPPSQVPPPAEHPVRQPPAAAASVPVAVLEPRAIRQVQPVVPSNVRGMLSRPLVVSVTLQIDAAGNVTDASYAPPSGTFGKYFAELALTAARRWKFEPARVGDRGVPSEKILEFRFGPSGR
jgi:hypothetical protein